MIDYDGWPLLLKGGFGNVFARGRWDHTGIVLIAKAINSGVWTAVERFAREEEWIDEMSD